MLQCFPTADNASNNSWKKLKQYGYLHQYHSNNPWTDLLSQSQHGEPNHVSWGILQGPFAENTEQCCYNPDFQAPRTHYVLCCKSTIIKAPNMKIEWQTDANKTKHKFSIVKNTKLKANSPSYNYSFKIFSSTCDHLLSVAHST